MAIVEKSIEVNVPVGSAYNQWTQFEMFPYFMEGVKEVKQLDDKHLLWRADIVGREEEWQAEIVEQVPDQRIAWTSTTGAKHAGVVTFHHISPDTSRVMLQLEYEPQGVIEHLGDLAGFVGRRVEGDLQRFKTFIEKGGEETGAWRGTIERD